MKVMFGNKPVEIGIQTARSEHTHDEYETKEEALLKLQEAKSYTDDAIEELYGADSANAPTIREIASDEVATALANFKPGIDEAAVAAIVELHNTDDSAHGNIKNDIALLQENKANIIHEHDDLYYTEEEIDNKFTSINEFIQEVQNGTEIIPKASYAESAMKDADGNTIVDTYETKTESIEKLTEAKSYADEAALKVKNDLLNGAADAYDTLKELGDLIDGNKTALDALELVANSKADAEHTHELSEILGDDTVLPIESGGTGATTAEEALINLGGKKIIQLTKAEFDALAEKDEKILYIITDDEEEDSDLEQDVNTLSSELYRVKNNLNELQTTTEDHIDDADLHVTADEKAKWNDQTGSSLCVQNIMIPASGWQDERETTAMYRYRIYNSNILENMKVNVDFKTDDATEEEASSLVKATNGGVLSITTANAGYVDIYAADNATFGITAPPTGNLKADLTLTQIKVV